MIMNIYLLLFFFFRCHQFKFFNIVSKNPFLPGLREHNKYNTTYTIKDNKDTAFYNVIT